MTTIKTLEDVQLYLISIPAIHSGGCGVSALAMYRWLEKHKKLDNTKFVYLYSSEYDYNRNSNIMKNRNGNLKAPDHCILLHEGQFIDASGIVNLKCWGNYVQIIDEEQLVRDSVKDKDASWNHAFERDKYIKEIEKKLKIDLSDIK
ncbi:MAG: hypothetical protein ACFFG0_10385 [Candidatus Thorarchaeota archaeon]